MTWRVAGAARATTGTRANQEDAFAIWPSGAQAATRRGEGLLAVVADGMGGHAGGEIAGNLACETFVATFTATDRAVGDRLEAALEAGNEAIAARAAGNGKLRGMGCTLVGAWIDAAGLRWISVGDSLLLLFRAPDVLRLNADHSLGAFLDNQARLNKISPAEAEANPYRNALRSALTGKAIEILDLRAEPYPLADGDWLILASDGIATLDGNEIGDIVYAGRHGPPDQMAERLIAAVLAKKAPDQDNTTVLALKVAADVAGIEADEAPTRILRPEAAPVAALLPDEDNGVETTQRIVQPPAYEAFLRRHRSAVVGLGMGLMFLIGWLLRALLE
ncbi:protein phosphatase 2C domain-containing protein [Hyphomicrobium sp.]|uniref:PP2C family protein-serine/threonine phosphatase n=1 Tax=Hyphomicrobium sp. TaxID=82 RepID=UPI0025C69B43|nr:protein phosphatase 2C domain-containing protein [Hyphomicrobium sp.]MCC7251578.1 serine/threonine-protein phosphatase [Hyphomicrobium sp.]